MVFSLDFIRLLSPLNPKRPGAADGRGLPFECSSVPQGELGEQGRREKTESGISFLMFQCNIDAEWLLGFGAGWRDSRGT